ncbi:MAG TPA: TIGR03016 family PEP-CTERM system-associated outer membrane protein [Steroidobacteraceae bacterium]|nr:TIGR03016 family PEP-CTERM system-associated outer membrane protein [Steroidobacteraceae bacterium]
MRRTTGAGGLIGTMLAAALPGAAMGAEIEFTPTVDASVTYTDNIELVPPGAAEESEFVLEAVPGFDWSYESARIKSGLGYRLTGLVYANDSDRNQAYHSGSLSFGSTLLEQWLFLDASGDYLQSTIEPRRAVNSNLMFQTQNVTDVGTYQVSPYVRHEFRRAVLEARYSRGWVKYRDEDPLQQLTLDDSENEERLATIGNRDDDDAKLTWQLTYEGQIAHYDLAADFQYEQAAAELGWRLNTSLRVFGRGGQESELTQDLTDGGLDTSWWDAGIELRSEQNRLIFSYGDRFFGRSMSGSWERTARVLRLSVKYSEVPTTWAQERALRSEATQPLVAPVPTEDLSRLTAEVFIRRDFDASVTLVGRRTELTLTGLRRRREYISLDLEDRERGIGLSGTRQLSGRSAIYASYYWDQFNLREGDEFTDQRIVLGANRQIGRTTSLAFDLSHIERDSSSVTLYDATWATLRFSKQF